MAQPIYMPQHDPLAGIRDIIMNFAMGYERNYQRGNQLDQMRNLLGMLQPNEQGMIDTTQLVNSVSDPGMIQGILPNILENNLGMARATRSARAEAGKPVKMTIRKGNKVQEIMVAQDRWNDTAAKLEEMGWSVSEKEPPQPGKPFDVQIGDDKVTLTHKLDADGTPMVDASGQPVYEPLRVGGEVARGPVKVPTVNINMPAKTPEAEMKSMVDLLSIQDSINTIKTLGTRRDPETGRLTYNTSWMGPVSGRISDVGASYGIPGTVPSEQEIQFRQVVDDIQDRVLRARSGAQINEQEAKRLKKFIPDYHKPAKTFWSQLKQFEQTYNDILAQKKTVLGQAGYIVPQGVQATGTTPGQFIMTKVLNGVTYGKTKGGQWVMIGEQ
jgi:hypothetical protein